MTEPADMTQPAAAITSISFRAADGYIHITRQDGTEHGMYSTARHASELAALHDVPLQQTR